MKKDKQGYTSYRLTVSAEFSEVFSHFYFAGNSSSQPQTNTLIPSFQTVMVFNFGAKAVLNSRQGREVEMDKCIVLGPIKSAFQYTLPPGSQILVANFKADAFYRFFGSAYLSDKEPINPDAAMDENCFTHLWSQLNTIPSVSAKVNCILDFCKPYLQAQHTISALLTTFESDSESIIKSIAQTTGQSERNIQLLHKKYFGYTAKEMNRYRRFLKAIQLIQEFVMSKNKVDWSDVIGICGYYDQSQLIHDFKHFIHLSPKSYLKFQQDICQSSAE
ncbi:AraC family transcriptional regulator [Sphingobacterium sp. N143]|uniref:helix-turn-helix domain-containing protein n=1 Tax=Sphingobacterium sp. N143 TaxID=2746727 RepID=UPI0025756CCC|nr:helix-turn-helix domain-containing protein [Sphingobacterium sp. N143]MDM1296317.1 AraC family transcriptional regulator [Sphingobacterium sp. N143]